MQVPFIIPTAAGTMDRSQKIILPRAAAIQNQHIVLLAFYFL
jgi:hypothetical protein